MLAEMSSGILFHSVHGSNITLSSGNLIATRSQSFSHGLVFSNRALHPGEIFLFQIEDDVADWTGDLRVGITMHNLSEEIGDDVPQYSLPNLVNLGKSWIYSLTGDRILESSNYDFTKRTDHANLFDVLKLKPIGCNSSTHHDGGETTMGSAPGEDDERPPMSLDSNGIEVNTELLCRQKKPYHVTNASAVGNRIGILFRVVDRENWKANLYITINGRLAGPLRTDIPYGQAPIYAVVDIYGRTKQISIIKTPGVQKLHAKCRRVIMNCVGSIDGVDKLPVPDKLKDFLKFGN